MEYAYEMRTKALAARTECRARHHRDMLVVNKTLTKFIGRHAGGLNGREHVKRALRLKAGKTETVEPIHNQTAAHVVLVAHFGNVVITVFQRFDCRVL